MSAEKEAISPREEDDVLHSTDSALRGVRDPARRSAGTQYSRLGEDRKVSNPLRECCALLKR